MALIANAIISSATSPVVTASRNTTGAGILFATLSSLGSDTVTFSDSYSNTWVLLTKRTYASANQLYYCLNPTVGTGHTFTMTATGAGGTCCLAIAAFDGKWVFEAEAGVAANAGVTTLQTGSLTPAFANSLLISCCGGPISHGNPTIDSSFTVTDANNTNSSYSVGLAYLLETAIAAKNPTWTVLSGDTISGVTLAVFKPSPSVAVTGSLSAFANTETGIQSSTQSFNVSGSAMTANLVVTAPNSDFQLSLSPNGIYGSSVSLTPTGGTISSTPVYVRFTPQSAGAKSGNITVASTGATTQNVAVSGTGTSPAFTTVTSFFASF